jgi:hypothetical protein
LGLSPYQAASEALAVAEAALGVDAPTLRYVALEMPALDCELLVVAGFQFSLDEVPETQRPAPRITRFLMMLWYVECIDTRAAPDSAKAQADAQRLLDRGWLVWRALASHSFGDCRVRTIGPAMAAPAAGGLAGWRIPLEVQVD